MASEKMFVMQERRSTKDQIGIRDNPHAMSNNEKDYLGQKVRYILLSLDIISCSLGHKLL